MAEISKPRVPCEQCDKTFSSVGNRNQYLKQVHSDERPHACTQGGCDKQFKTNAHLATHERTHTLERPFQCKQCSKSFSQSGNLIVHTRSHTGERPYRCEECSKAFTTTGKLTVHARIHSGEKPFACTLCDKRFAESTTLTIHLRTHTGAKPYKCEFCDYSATNSSNVIAHERRKHTDEFNALQAAFESGSMAAVEAMIAGEEE